MGSKKNDESFKSAFKAMKDCNDPILKLQLLDLMASFNPQKTK
jgi:hypothetical protein